MQRSADWMDPAEGDLDHARYSLQGGYYDWASFSAQQSAEKAVKAVLQQAGAEAWGHSIVDLLAALMHRQEVSDDLLDAASELDKAYIPTRYPDALQSSSPRRRYRHAEAERMIENADRIVRYCQSLLA